MKIFSPKAKILLYVLLATTVFVSHSFSVSLLSLGFVIFFAIRLPFSTLKRGLIPIILFLTFTFISNVLFQTGNVLYEISGLSITDEGLRRGSLLTLKLFILILGAKVLTSTTKAEDLVNGMSELLGPLGKTGFVKELIFTMSLTLRLLPIVYNEALELYKDVKNSEGTSLAGKIRLSVSLLTPLFERSLKKAREMSDTEKDFEH
ncbi:energy-coupling factor transporter transmembrane protein EcfT [bacterium BMS3Abin06]|nr:energy-coupling factor transporter transmembrane protein EcfT [bacterium BMS3Abin06]